MIKYIMITYEVTPNKKILITHATKTLFGKRIEKIWLVNSFDQSFGLKLPNDKIEYSDNFFNKLHQTESGHLQDVLIEIMQEKKPWPNVIVKNNKILATIEG